MLVVLLLFAVAMLALIVSLLEMDAHDVRVRARCAEVILAPVETPARREAPVPAPALGQGLRIATS